jgi:hypothetical protein
LTNPEDVETDLQNKIKTIGFVLSHGVIEEVKAFHRAQRDFGTIDAAAVASKKAFFKSLIECVVKPAYSFVCTLMMKQIAANKEAIPRDYEARSISMSSSAILGA